MKQSKVVYNVNVTRCEVLRECNNVIFTLDISIPEKSEKWNLKRTLKDIMYFDICIKEASTNFNSSLPIINFNKVHIGILSNTVTSYLNETCRNISQINLTQLSYFFDDQLRGKRQEFSNDNILNVLKSQILRCGYLLIKTFNRNSPNNDNNEWERKFVVLGVDLFIYDDESLFNEKNMTDNVISLDSYFVNIMNDDENDFNIFCDSIIISCRAETKQQMKNWICVLITDLDF